MDVLKTIMQNWFGPQLKRTLPRSQKLWQMLDCKNKLVLVTVLRNRDQLCLVNLCKNTWNMFSINSLYEQQSNCVLFKHKHIFLMT